MGLFKEIVVDRSVMGERFEQNIVVIAACNPFRTQATTNGDCLQENDLGREWASGHYQVVDLSTSLKKVKWAFGSLTHDQEKDLIYHRMKKQGSETMPPYLEKAMTEVVAAAHEAIREFAYRNILKGLAHVTAKESSDITEMALRNEAQSRAKSVVSLRDIQRVFSLYEFFSTEFIVLGVSKKWEYMLLAVGIAYYFRLDEESRVDFKRIISSLSTEKGAKSLQMVLDEAMESIIGETEIPQGIATTRGLKENLFMTLSCLLSKTPLLIVGPPGTSMTLAVNIISDNANGEDSPGTFYRKFPHLYHYQCSKQLTSKEMAAAFEKAVQRQANSNSKKNLSFVFLDEAGRLPEERESLKVLHYLLEGHMSIKSDVRFVAISNHVLDAAKSNRCAMLLRQNPDNEES